MRSVRPGTFLALLLAAALVGGCGTTTATRATAHGSGTSSATTTPSTTHGAVIHTKTITVNGRSVTVLADSKGLTLYYFMLDTPNTVACTTTCAKNWPPLLSTGGAPSSSAPLPGKLTVLSGTDGQQVLYNGHPLYTYAKDGDAGDAYGEGVGGKWYVATPDLAAQAAAATRVAISPGGSSGGNRG
jgi:predicted lipoprotein with Yx(FWY)xxD motif